MTDKNEFLDGVRIEQFIKGNNDKISDTLGGVSSILVGNFKDAMIVQKQQLYTMGTIDKRVSSIDKNIASLLKIQENMLKVLAKQTGNAGDKYIKEILKSKQYTSARIDTKSTARRNTTEKTKSQRKDKVKYLTKTTGLDKSSVKDAVSASSFASQDTGKETVTYLALMTSQMSQMLDAQKEAEQKSTNWFKWIRTAFMFIKAIDFGKTVITFLRNKFPNIDESFNKIEGWFDNLLSGFSDIGRGFSDVGRQISTAILWLMKGINKMPFIKGDLDADITNLSNNTRMSDSQQKTYIRNFRSMGEHERGGYSTMRKNANVTPNSIQDNNNLTAFMGHRNIPQVSASTTRSVMPISTTGLSSLSDVFGASYDGPIQAEANRPNDATGYFTRGTVNLNGIRPNVWNNFRGMVADYMSLHPDAEPIQINSGFRTIAKQQELWEEYQAKLASGQQNVLPVALPGKSMHQYGYAIDIQGADADRLAEDNLLSKWNFGRPVNAGKATWERHHIEPRGLDYAKIRSNIGVSGGDSPEADGLTPMPVSSAGITSNIPTSRVPSRRGTNNDPVSVSLSTEDINELASAVGAQIKSNTKLPNIRPVPNNTGSPRSL